VVVELVLDQTAMELLGRNLQVAVAVVVETKLAVPWVAQVVQVLL
jgi:hypothetical protein